MLVTMPSIYPTKLPSYQQRQYQKISQQERPAQCGELKATAVHEFRGGRNFATSNTHAFPMAAPAQKTARRR